jgi:hypothetical protein
LRLKLTYWPFVLPASKANSAIGVSFLRYECGPSGSKNHAQADTRGIVAVITLRSLAHRVLTDPQRLEPTITVPSKRPTNRSGTFRRTAWSLEEQAIFGSSRRELAGGNVGGTISSLDYLASTYRSDFRIQNQTDQSKAPAARPPQSVPYESTVGPLWVQKLTSFDDFVDAN